MAFSLGKDIEPSAVTVSKAKEMVQYLQSGKHPYVKLIGCKNNGAHDIIIFEVQPDVPQRVVHPIKYREEIALLFHPDDIAVPEVLSLRADFPRNVPHLNPRPEYPYASLCLYQQSYQDIKLKWTTARFLEDIRSWLSRTALGELHGTDQPLEPLLLVTTSYIILPDDLFEPEKAQSCEKIYIHCVKTNESDRPVFTASRENKGNTRFLATGIVAPTRQHGTIYQPPGNLAELHGLMGTMAYDLLSELRERLKKWIGNKEILDSPFCLIVWFPKTLKKDEAPEVSDIWVFATSATVRDVGVDIGIFQRHQEAAGRVAADALLLSPDTSKTGENIPIDVLNPVSELSRKQAAILNGSDNAVDLPIVGIGMGALGSQILMNLTKAAYGKWTLVDHDVMLPHNLARHAAASHEYVGHTKPYVMQFLANSSVGNDLTVTDFIPANVLNPDAHAEALNAAYTKAGLILDMSASVPVARHLARNVEAEARRVSAFLNPKGTDLVILAEDKKRDITLDMLEMQYYRALIQTPELADHLLLDEEHLRYGRSCRDLSSQIPQDYVALHAAIASRALRKIQASEEASIDIWRIIPDMLNVVHIPVQPSFPVTLEVGDWRICMDEEFIETLRQYRQVKLPCETGGVLLGCFDMQRKIVYIVDTIPSPRDSKEEPALFIRGHKGLRKSIEGISKTTANMFEYVGEWHSHPDGAACRPSQDDLRLYAWLEDYRAMDGFPPVMLIVGENEIFCAIADTATTLELKKKRSNPLCQKKNSMPMNTSA